MGDPSLNSAACPRQVPAVSPRPRGGGLPGGVVGRQQAPGQWEQRQHAEGLERQDGQAERRPARARGRGSIFYPVDLVFCMGLGRFRVDRGPPPVAAVYSI